MFSSFGITDVKYIQERCIANAPVFLTTNIEIATIYTRILYE